jgi:hypothetical protein
MIPAVIRTQLPRIKVKYYIVALVLILVYISFRLMSSFYGAESTDESR